MMIYDRLVKNILRLKTNQSASAENLRCYLKFQTRRHAKHIHPLRQCKATPLNTLRFEQVTDDRVTFQKATFK